ncbi:hypothetical protein PFISCL1PPCAC_26507, partial [Pristionchus fissidentatus]
YKENVYAVHFAHLEMFSESVTVVGSVAKVVSVMIMMVSYMVHLSDVVDDGFLEARLRGVMDCNVLHSSDRLAVMMVVVMVESAAGASAKSVVVVMVGVTMEGASSAVERDVGAVGEVNHGLGLTTGVHLLDPRDLASAVFLDLESMLGNGEFLPRVVCPSERVDERLFGGCLSRLLLLGKISGNGSGEDLALNGGVGGLSILLGRFSSIRLLSLINRVCGLLSVLLNLSFDVLLRLNYLLGGSLSLGFSLILIGLSSLLASHLLIFVSFYRFIIRNGVFLSRFLILFIINSLFTILDVVLISSLVLIKSSVAISILIILCVCRNLISLRSCIIGLLELVGNLGGIVYFSLDHSGCGEISEKCDENQYPQPHLQ